MKSNKLTSLLCALALTGAVMPLSMAEAAEPALTAPAAAVQEAPSQSVNYTDALMKGLSLTLPDVQSAVESGTFKNLSPEAPKPAEPEPAPPPAQPVVSRRSLFNFAGRPLSSESSS